jgi:ubiquinone/menaquinone biosynthesis C-methylase UbiE
MKRVLLKLNNPEIERKRYNLSNLEYVRTPSSVPNEGFQEFPNHHKQPFRCYYNEIQKNLPDKVDILEIGAGTGQHTRPVVTTTTKVTAIDISENSLEVLRTRFGNEVQTVIGNIENLPFTDSSFDLVISCGALSYGDQDLVNSEIKRVLRHGGSFIFLDSLNHNLIYKMNRYLRWALRTRSLSTVLRIPKLKRIRDLQLSFKYSNVYYFGSYLWIYEIFNFLLGERNAARISNFLESSFPSGKYAFKVVVVLESFKK